LTYVLNFNKGEISSLQFDYAKINFRPEQLKLVTTISNLICEQIAIPKLAMRGTAWYAMREWQQRENKLISEISTMNMREKLSATKKIFNIGKDKLKQMLSYPKEQSEVLLDIFFERAFKYYLDHLSRTQR
jgi:hypothetical protein